MYFLGRTPFGSPRDLWILDTRSGKLTQGPSMKAVLRPNVAGVIDGKIYVIGSVVGFAGYDEKIQVEVFDPESRIWKSAGEEKVLPRPWWSQSIASLEGKIYIVDCGTTSVYSPREGRRKRLVHMVNERLVECSWRGGEKEMLDETVELVCVVENVLYACFARSGLMWFDTKLKIWRRLLIHDENNVLLLPVQGMSEYDGKLAVFKSLYDLRNDTKSVKMFLIPLHVVGEKICGTIEWSGIVTTNTFPACLVGSGESQFIR